jgi:SPP1 family predicted phage head-tail adaptor
LATFEKRSTEPDDHNGDFDTWEQAFTEWVEVKPGAGKLQVTESTVNAQQIVERGTDLVRMRYREDVTSDLRVTVDRTRFGIVRIIDVDFRHEWLELETIIEDATKVVTV